MSRTGQVWEAAPLIAASLRFPKPAGLQPAYGTAGFRCEAFQLTSTAFRCGLLTAARALLQGKHFGIMVTASHNPACDNGLKLIEPSGEMPPPAWEAAATEIACAGSNEAVAELILRLLQQTGSSTRSGDLDSAHSVLLGYDTRPSAPALTAAVRAGVQALGVTVLDAGLVTTPQLHFLTHASNSGRMAGATLDSYFNLLLGAYEALTAGTTPLGGALHVDCANGVGAHLLQRASTRMVAAGLVMELHNTGGGGLNLGCGADFVQKERVLPSAFGIPQHTDRCCSLDGDADRLVYFSNDAPPQGSLAGAAASPGGVRLLDGDKIAVLAAAYISDLLLQLPPHIASGLQVGVVQTAYANGASTAYITGPLGLRVACTPTGVKHLHAAAHHLDIGIYWEANGHGTVLFSAGLQSKLQQLPDLPAARSLLLLARMINQTVGDALSGILLVEAVLRCKPWSLSEWHALYTDLPSRMTKLVVADRSIFSTEDAERRCVTPVGLQGAIDALVQQFSSARCFVRPSGTEDAVRVYAEAATQKAADELARRVGQAVYDMAGGVGARP